MIIGKYKYRMLASGRWEASRGDFIMAVFGTRGEARDYCKMKHDQEEGN